MAYLTKENVENYLNIDLTPQGETLVDSLIPAVEAYVNSYCSRSWNNSSPQTEYLDGGQNLYFLANSPVTSITSIVVDGTTLASTEYFLYSSYIRLDYPATTDYRNVVITYVSNVPLPNDLKQALIQWVAEMFKNADDGGKTAERVKFGSAETWFKTQDGIPKFVQDVLNRYRLMHV